MATPYYRTAAYRSAVAHPFHVSAFADWSEATVPVTVGFQTEAEARAFASMRPEPIIDLARKGDGVIAVRRMIDHPLLPGLASMHDDFPETRP